ncbi:HNH endonuclease [uncultured Microscilla sp.]|uniref:HNH endonuclease n=1 Tax=uncultured Microscilla sp. TaxID=432653 RepID=UPI002632C534|nr:HNH endonuclease [uncultured Microscilla sp.]
MSEELLGADITKPLPGEVVVNNTQDAVKTAEEQGKITQQDSQVLKKTKLEAKDVKVDPVVQNPILSPELQKLIAGLPEGKELEFGEQPDLDQKKNVEEIKQEAAGVASTEAKKTQDTDTSQNSTTSTETKQPQGSTKEGQIGPFAGPMERLGYLTGTMKKAVAEWWTKNKVTVIIGLVAGIAGLILANIATGGAIMAALPLLLQIVGAIFTGIGILDMAKHFGKYLSQAFPDKTIAGGAKSLARGLAALTIELIFSLLFGGKALLKSAKKGIKTVAKGGVKAGVKAGAKAARKSAVKGIKNTAQNFKDLGGVAKKGGQALVKNGKMVFKGMKRGALAGAKTLDDVAQKLVKKFRVKKMKITIKKKKWILWGMFNPWYRMANGDIVESPDTKMSNRGTVKVDGKKVKVTEQVKQSDIERRVIVDPQTGHKRKATYDESGDEVNFINKYGVNETEIRYVGSRAPRNAKKYAGKTFPLPRSLRRKYGKGVKFSKKGFPDFEAVLKAKGIKYKKTTITMSANSAQDIAAANKKVFNHSTNRPSEFKDYTWHHSEDGSSMILVPRDLHDYVKHTGGDAITRHG